MLHGLSHGSLADWWQRLWIISRGHWLSLSLWLCLVCIVVILWLLLHHWRTLQYIKIGRVVEIFLEWGWIKGVKSLVLNEVLHLEDVVALTLQLL